MDDLDETVMNLEKVTHKNEVPSDDGRNNVLTLIINVVVIIEKRSNRSRSVDDYFFNKMTKINITFYTTEKAFHPLLILCNLSLKITMMNHVFRAV